MWTRNRVTAANMRRIAWSASLSIVMLLFSLVIPARAQIPVVRAVLFFSPTCPHCHKVMTEDLPPLIERYQDQLVILVVDTTTPGGSELFHAAMEYFEVPPDKYFVPTLVVGELLLVGSTDIPEQLPGIIVDGLAAGGVDWPKVPGLEVAISSVEEQLEATREARPTEGVASAPTAVEIFETPTPSVSATLPDLDRSVPDRIMQDPVGNSISILVLLGMIAISGAVLVSWFAWPARLPLVVPRWLIPLLSIVGIGVAGYLTYIEFAHVEAVCGPVGDCNTVYQSQYARLFGVLPLGLIGLICYLLILAVNLFARMRRGSFSNWAAVSQFALATLGTLFSIYLTGLEPFVIGATCAWCLSSAVLITGLMWFSSGAAREAVTRLRA